KDSSRLPVGFQRIAYDADTQQYTFRDENGSLYYSASGEEYGQLSILRSAARAEAASTEPKPKRSQTAPSSLPAPKSFYDILPPESIGSAGSTTSLSSSSPTSPSRSPRSRFIAAAKRSTMPRMQSVVHGLVKRSVTLRKKQGNQTGHQDQ
ncbi:hypothetical protein F5876DRAFT_26740, partial [Lentinula aff. lateritia]